MIIGGSQARTVVHKNRAKISHKIYYKENSSLLRSHRQIATLGVAVDWVLLCSRRQEIVNFSRTSKIVIGGVGYLKVSRSSHDLGPGLRLLVNAWTCRSAKVVLGQKFLGAKTHKDKDDN